MKRTIPLIIASATGLVLIVSWFIPYTESWGDKAMIWFDILASVALILGGANLLKTHLQKMSDRRAGWGYSLVTVVALVVTAAMGLFKFAVSPSEEFPDYSWSGDYMTEGGGLWWIYQYVILPITATMFAMLAFYVSSAAFRAFRAKNVEACILLGTAFIVLLGRTYAGVWLTSFIPQDSAFAILKLENLTGTIMDVFNTAGNRAIMIGIALGIVSTSLKVILGVDRSYLGGEE